MVIGGREYVHIPVCPQVNKNILERESCWYIGLTNGGVKSTETRVTEILLEN